MIGSATYDLTPNASTGLLNATSLGSVSTTSGYNAYAELMSHGATFGGAPLYTATYGRDGLGRITSLAETVQGQTTTREFSYDVLGRLTQVRDGATQEQLERYAYGANSNRDTAWVLGGPVRYAGYDAQDRQTSDGSATFTYTGAGERRRRIDGAASQTTTYDALGNLRAVDLPGGTTITYVVDGRNRRVGRKVNGTWTHRWLYQNALSVVAELDGSGVLKKRFVYASRGHVPDVMVVKNASGPDDVYRLITDHLGSVRLVVNVATGVVAQRLAYDAWGNVTEDTAPGFQPFGYAGGLYDPETGLVRFGARDYDARVGRWLSKDPIGVAGESTNDFAYCDGDPIDYFDANGASRVRNETGIPVVVEGGGGRGLGHEGGPDLYGVVPPDAKREAGGPSAPVPGYRDKETAMWIAEQLARGVLMCPLPQPDGLIYDIDDYVDSNGNRVRIQGSEKGPLYRLVLRKDGAVGHVADRNLLRFAREYAEAGWDKFREKRKR